MKKVALLGAVGVACAACGHKAPPASKVADEPGSGDIPANHDVAKPAVGPAVIGVGPAVAALAGDGPHAFVADASGLIEVAPSGQTLQIAATQPHWCSVDARAQVVWFLADGGLAAFDLVDRRVHPVVAGDADSDAIEIDWGNEQLGAESKVEFSVALALRLTRPPKVDSELGCDGDQGVYCFEEDGQTLRPELVEKQKKLEALHLADAAYVTSLVERGAKASLWTPPPTPPAKPAKKPKVDRKKCEEDASVCGKLTAIPASPLWLVSTANSRGDFYHETRELWDPATGEWLGISGGKLTRTPKPQFGEAETDYQDLRIAPNGLLSYQGVVFDPAHVVYAPTGDSPMTCGWSTGGWRMPGITE